MAKLVVLITTEGFAALNMPDKARGVKRQRVQSLGLQRFDQYVYGCKIAGLEKRAVKGNGGDGRALLPMVC